MNYTIAPSEKIEFELNSLYATFEQLSDRRKARGKRYELALILTLSVLAKLAGQDEPEGIAEWVKLRGESLACGIGHKPGDIAACGHLSTGVGESRQYSGIGASHGRVFQAMCRRQ